MSLHHIIADAWSVRILNNEFVQLYNQNMMGQPSSLPPMEAHYHDFAYWQENNIKTNAKLYAEQIAYWMRYLADAPHFLNIPTDYRRPEQEPNQGDYVQRDCDHDLYERIKAKALSLNTTPFTVLLATFHILLHRYTNQEDILIGYPVNNRQFSELENSIGYYANTLTSRMKFSETTNTLDIVKKLKEDIAQAQLHQDVPFDALVDEFVHERQLSYHPIFQVMFVMQDDRFELKKLYGIESEYLPPQQGIAKFDLMLSALPAPTGYVFEFEFATSLFEKTTIKHLSDCYITLLEQIVALDNINVEALQLLSEDHRSCLLQINQTESVLPNCSSFIQFLNLTDHNKLKKIAIEYGKRKLTFQQLETKSNQLANYLLRRGIRQGHVVAVYLENSDFMILSVLAILKIGAIYMPVEVDTPKSHFLHDGKCVSKRRYQFKYLDIKIRT